MNSFPACTNPCVHAQTLKELQHRGVALPVGCVGVHPLLNYVTRQNLSHASTFSQSSSSSSSKASTKMSSAAHRRKYCAPMHSFEGRNSTAPAPSNLSARKELSTYTVVFFVYWMLPLNTAPGSCLMYNRACEYQQCWNADNNESMEKGFSLIKNRYLLVESQSWHSTA